ncbi:MAG: hypothetical protein GY795_20595 [Desulfobacterales bacterium]|nr:hypothetical protein [Desulfobacterales bacterium]
MNNREFKQIIITFADNPNDIEYSKDQAVFQIRDELIQIEFMQEKMSLYVIEENEKFLAENWIVNRLAMLPQLAGRLIDYTTTEKHFVNPKGDLLDQIANNPEEDLIKVDNTLNTINEVLDKRSGFSSNVLYLTSDAGEGKTTLINELTKRQAYAYKNKQTDWLLVPILLGGRPFLRFDDVVIASLVNVYRFRLFFWESFIEMVKLGAIIPAFDGFEEMFVESTTDEALSSLGNLLNQLESSGSILIAARKAYFDFKSFSTQAKLYDTIHSDVSFSKLSIRRWGKEQFLEYSNKRNINNGEVIYDTVEKKLGKEHPILTRAVLIKRLLDVTEKLDSEDEINNKLGDTTKDYFSNFIDSIIEREVTTKWIDRSGSPAKPLLNIEEHHILLSMIAQEMWYTNSHSVKSDVLDFISDLYSETYKKSSQVSNQIKERLKQHALLISFGLHLKEFSFDHDEFRQYFLGRALAENIIKEETTEVRSILRASLFANQTAETSVNLIKQRKEKISSAIKFIQNLCIKESPISFIRENCGMIVIRLVDNFSSKEKMQIENMAFPTDSLFFRKINNIIFKKSYFKSTDLKNSTLTNCEFIDCAIERIGFFESTEIRNIKINNSTIESILSNGNEIFDPNGINILLSEKGFVFIGDNEKNIKTDEKYEPDNDLIFAEKILRRFIRSTQINENIIKLRLGNDTKYFLNRVLPALIDVGLLVEVPYLGGGRQKRYKLGHPMNKVNDALTQCEGKFDLFIETFRHSGS